MAKLLQNFFGDSTSGEIVALNLQIPVAADGVDQWVWLHPGDGKVYELVGVKALWGTAGGAAAVLMLEKASGTTAVASGTDLLTANVDLTATADTVVTPTLISTQDTLKFIDGERVGADFGGTITPLAGLLVQLRFRVAAY